MQNIGQSTVLNLSIPIPPEPEMKVITDYLDGRLDTIDKSESKAKKQISLLQERRTALISAAVTGKIDVRDWKPPESQEDESIIPVEEVCSI